MRYLLILLFVSLFMSCSMFRNYQQIHRVTSKTYIGMHVNEFLQIADRRYSHDAKNSEVYVYRVNQFDINGRMIDSMFYYFDADTDKLIKVDGGTKWN